MASEYRAPLTFRGGGINAERRLRVPWAFGGTSYSDLEMVLDEIIFEQQRYGTAVTAQAAQTTAAAGVLTFSGSAATEQAAQTTEATGSVSANVTGTAATEQAAQTTAAVGTVTSGEAEGWDPRGFGEWIPLDIAKLLEDEPKQQKITGTAMTAQKRQRTAATGRNMQRVTGAAAVVQFRQRTTATGEVSTARRDERDLLQMFLLDVA